MTAATHPQILDGARYAVDAHVAEVTLAEPATHNAFSPTLLEGLHRSLDLAQRQQDARVVLIRAEGKNFSAGGNLKAMLSAHEQEEDALSAEARPIADLFGRIGSFPKPVVTAVQGAAIGGGLGLVCAADLAIAASNARFSCPEVRLGLFPFLLMPALRKALGDRRALHIALTATEMNAQEALDAGLVNETVEPAQLDDRARAFARLIAGSSPTAMALGVRAFRDTRGMSWEAALEVQLRIRSQCMRGPDLKEGITAFLEKRAPVWHSGAPDGTEGSR